MGRSLCPTPRAESVNSLRLQTGQAPSMEADIRMALNSGYHLLRRMTASTPFYKHQSIGCCTCIQQLPALFGRSTGPLSEDWVSPERKIAAIHVIAAGPTFLRRGYPVFDRNRCRPRGTLEQSNFQIRIRSGQRSRRRAELLYPNLHPLMALGGLGDVGPQKPVSPR